MTAERRENAPPEADASLAEWNAAVRQVRRAFESHERETHDALDASRMRAGNVLRPAVEAVAATPRVLASALASLVDAAASRFQAAAGSTERAAEHCRDEALRLEKAWDKAREAAEASQLADLARVEADRAEARRFALEALRAGHQDLLRVERRAGYARAFAMAVPAFTVAFGLGMLSEYWRSAAASTNAASASLTSLEQAAVTSRRALEGTREELAAASRSVAEQLASAGPGLAVISAMRELPPAEFAAAQAIIAELARGGQRGTALAAVREAMAASPGARRDGMEFAKIADGPTRAALLDIAHASGSTTRWTGETTYPGCWANGPSIQASGRAMATCLVELPASWPAQPDTRLRQYYRATEGRQ